MMFSTVFISFAYIAVVHCVMYTNRFGDRYFTDCAFDYPCRVFCPLERGYVCWRTPDNNYGTLCTPSPEFNPNSPDTWKELCQNKTVHTCKFF